MGNKKGYTAVELVIVIALFTVGYFVAANMLSYNFDVNYKEDMYNLKIASIEEQAAIYAETQPDMFTESNDVYMTVEELALNNAVVSTSDGVVTDPRDNEESLNDLRVKITNDDSKITAEVLV